ncbi:hypothetical protein ABV23_RS00885 [Escherichia coli]|nr:hypothetical protein [Escherichia coli]
MFQSNTNVGKQVQLLEDVSTMSGTFTKGHIMTIIAETSRGWDLEDADGNHILEAGFYGHREYKIID